MSAPVDVLAVMAEMESFMAASYPHYDSAEKLRAARAAMAELIEASRRVAVAATRGDDSHPGTIRNADLDALRATLARVGGAK